MKKCKNIEKLCVSAIKIYCMVVIWNICKFCDPRQREP